MSFGQSRLGVPEIWSVVNPAMASVGKAISKQTGGHPMSLSILVRATEMAWNISVAVPTWSSGRMHFAGKKRLHLHEFMIAHVCLFLKVFKGVILEMWNHVLLEASAIRTPMTLKW